MIPEMSDQTSHYVPDLAGGVYLYADEASCGIVPRLVATLTMHIRQDVLEDAVNDVMSLFPHLPVRLAEEDGSYVFVRNGSRIPVFSESADCQAVLGSEALGGFLFRVSFCGKTIFFDVHSSLLDERGLSAFAKSVIFRYIQLSGYPIANDGNVRVLPDGSVHVSVDDPLELVEDIPAARPAWYMEAKAFCSLSSCRQPSSHIVQMRVPASRLRSGIRGFWNLPETFVAPVVSHALYEQYAGKMSPGEYIVAAISVNLRQYFPTVSLRPFFTTVSLAYNRRIGEYPFNTILMSQKKLLEAQLKTDALAYNAQRKMRDMEKVCGVKGIGDKAAVAEKMVNAKASSSTYVIRNAGTVGMPESMDRYITEFYPVYSPGLHDLAVSSVVFRNDLFLTFAGKDAMMTRTVCNRIADLMNANDIYAYISDEFDFSPVCYKRP